MDETQQLKHRLAMVLDDMHFIRKHIEENGLTEIFHKPTAMTDYCWTHIHNIEIACMWRFTKNNGITEGFHRKMKLIQRRAYGFRNFNNYRLRVIAQCG